MMGQVLRRFVPRAPRYVLRPNDNQMLRFAPNKVHNRSHSTRFLNVSETGLAFLIERSSAPTIGELIKIEFAVPGGEQIAWFAKVIRLEEYSPNAWWTHQDSLDHHRDVLVGIQFHQLPDAHRQSIRVHLQAKFREVLRNRQMARWENARTFFTEHGLKLLIYAISALLTFAILYLLSRPSPNYDSKRGAPWGQRFKVDF